MSVLESPAAEAPATAAPDRWPTMDVTERMRLQYEVEQFLYAEAALLDARRYRDWLGLLAEDIHYWMPIRRTVSTADLDLEFTQPGEMAYFDDDLRFLEMRVKKLEAGSAWSEDPPSRSRHFVSNVRILGVAGDSRFRLVQRVSVSITVVGRPPAHHSPFIRTNRTFRIATILFARRSGNESCA